MTDAKASTPGHEPTDARVRPIAVFGAALAALSVGVLFLSRAILSWLDESARGADPVVEWPAQEPAGPKLQADPQLDYRAFRALQLERLSSYGWVDREAGTVRVPVERALEMVASDGLPARAEGEGE